MTTVISSPQELQDEGFVLIEPDTIFSTQAFAQAMSEMVKLVDTTPKLQERAPWPYQMRYAAMASCRRRNLLAYEQGLGKTYIESLSLWKTYGTQLRSGKARPNTISIISPKHTLRLVWMKELEKAGLAQFAEVISTERQVLHSKAPIWIMSYDFLKTLTGATRAAAKANAKLAFRPSGEPKEAMWQLILKQTGYPKKVVLDEIHKLRKGSNRTQTIQAYVRRIKRRDGLTGTPADGWVEHLEAILQTLYGRKTTDFPYDVNGFSARFTKERVVDLDPLTGESGGQGKKRKVPGINPDQLSEFYTQTQPLMHRLVFTDPEVSPNVQFPEAIYEDVHITMDEGHREFYHRTNAFVMNELRELLAAMEAEKLKFGGVRNVKSYRSGVLGKLQFLRRAAACPWSFKDPFPAYEADTLKIEKTLSICREHVDAGRKVIIFCNFKGSARRVHERLKEAGFTVHRIYAEDETCRPRLLKQDQREARIEEWQEDPKAQILLASLPIVAEGLTLTEARVIIHFDHDWKANLYKQGNSRVIRPSSDKSAVYIYNLLIRQSIELYLFKALSDKLAATKHMIDRNFLDDAPEDPLELDPLAIGKALVADQDRMAA